MLEETEARRRLIEATPLGSVSEISLVSALGAVSAVDLRAVIPVPVFDNCQMDGYAVRSADAIAGRVLQLAGEQPAGLDLGTVVEPGTAVRVFTGAPLPRGADAVVMQEDVDAFAAEIHLRETTEPDEFVRRRGADLCEGQVVLREGDRLTPGRLALLASQGWDRVLIRQAPSAAVVTTGMNWSIPAPEMRLLPGQIFNSNRAMLTAGLQSYGVASVQSFHAPDDPVRLRATLEEALHSSDFCLVAGGVSVGEKDYVKAVLGDLGVSGGFWKVRVKPGKPFFSGPSIAR